MRNAKHILEKRISSLDPSDVYDLARETLQKVQGNFYNAIDSLIENPTFDKYRRIQGHFRTLKKYDLFEGPYIAIHQAVQERDVERISELVETVKIMDV